jgi:hypothetical protein
MFFQNLIAISAVFFASVVLSPLMVKAEDRQLLIVSKSEALALGNKLLAAINPVSPENKYMPDLMKEKIEWVFSKYSAKELDLLFIESYGDGTSPVFMTSMLVNDRPRIEIYLARWITYIRFQRKMKTGFDQMTKNLFAISLVHEAVHMERANKWAQLSKEWLREEVRVWKKVDLGIVRPLREIGQPVEIDLIEFDELMKSHPCMSLNCPELYEYLEKKCGAGIKPK